MVDYFVHVHCVNDKLVAVARLNIREGHLNVPSSSSAFWILTALFPYSLYKQSYKTADHNYPVGKTCISQNYNINEIVHL